MTEKTVGARVRAPLQAARRAARDWRKGRQRERPVSVASARPASLLAHPLFADLSPNEAAILSIFMSRESVPTGTVIVREGARDGDLYLIESGEVAVRRRDPSGGEQLAATLGPGDFFGEIAFVTGEARTADVVARTPTTLLRLSRDAYATLSELAAAEELGRVGAARTTMNKGAGGRRAS